MSEITDLARLSFFSADKYAHDNEHVCDFTEIPRPHYCMGLIEKGTGEFISGGRITRVCEGEIIFVPIGSTYKSCWRGDGGVKYTSAHFSFERAGLIPRTHRLELQRVTLDGDSMLGDKFSEMYRRSQGTKDMQLSALAIFYDIISRVYPKLSYTETAAFDPRIEKAIDYIELHCADRVPIEALARMCNMSVSHFHARFKELTGCTPIGYKHEACIRRAKLMLLEEDGRSIEEISERLGFSGAIYFREIFKKITGKTPAAYRKMEKESHAGGI